MRLGRVDQALVARLYARTVLNTVSALSPPTVISCPPTTAAPSPLAGLGIDGSVAHLSVAGSKRCNAAVLLVSDIPCPPTAYR